MAKLIYGAITSLDGYINDETGGFEWAEPDEEVHAFANDLERPIGTHLYGRRMYEVMQAWETMDDAAPLMQDYATSWRAADKVVYSTTLTSVVSERTRIEPTFDPEVVRAMKATATKDINVGGANLAAQAIAAGLVDEYHVLLNPVVVGGGTPWLPDGVRVDLELFDEHRFTGGVVHLAYRPRVDPGGISRSSAG
jgi:dihydrofolate reductase